MEKNKIRYEWEDTGTLDISVRGNLDAVIRYRPSAKFVQETLSKFAKNNGNQQQTDTPPHTKADTKSPQNAIVSLTDDIQDRLSYSNCCSKRSFSDLSREVRYNMRKGYWDRLAENYICMAEILHTEKKWKDELKCLLLAFHLRLSGEAEPSVADETLVALSKEAARRASVSKKDMVALYKDSVGAGITPSHLYSIDEACHIYCIIWQSMW